MICMEILRYIHKHFVDRIHNNILWRNILAVNIIDSRTVLHIERHSRRRNDKVDGQFGKRFKLGKKTGLSLQALPWYSA